MPSDHSGGINNKTGTFFIESVPEFLLILK